MGGRLGPTQGRRGGATRGRLAAQVSEHVARGRELASLAQSHDRSAGARVIQGVFALVLEPR
jgi:hypothetical protein